MTAATSNATTGVYTTIAVAPGSYYLRTQNSLGYMDQIYQNIPCSNCNLANGTLATLAAPTTTIDFALSQAARLSGIVRGTGGTPLGSVSVQVDPSAGVGVASGTSASATGLYTISGLPPGTYYVRTLNSGAYINQLYSGTTCEPSCTVTSGTPLTLGAGTTTLDFSLTIGAKITGVVKSGGISLSGVSVDVINAAGTTVKTATTGASGAYAATGLPTGNYFVRTRNAQGYFDELYDNIPCSSCSVTTSGGTAVPVTAGGLGDAPNVDFDLVRGGQITGLVSDAVTAAGIPSTSVQVVDAAGRIVGSSTTTSLGAYATTGLPTGRYFVRASPSSTTAYITAVYDTLQCLPCLVTDGLPVGVTLGTVTSGIDIALQKGGRISGTVMGGSSPAPLNVQIDFINSAGTTVSSIASAPNTGVDTSSGLPAGTYFARTRAMGATAFTPAASQGFINEVYDDFACSGCNPTTGTPITVTFDATTPNINFVLTPGGRVSGHVNDANTSLPIPGTTIQFFSQAGLLAGSVSTDAGGNYTLPDGLVAGDYYARTTNSAGYINRLYDAVPPCFPTCTPTSGTAIPVPAAGMAGNVDFALQSGGRISGTITDLATGLPLAGISARIYDSLGVLVNAPSSSSAGTYISGAGLPAGTYYVATSNNVGYINKVHSGTPCLGCSPAAAGSAVPVALGATTSGIDFALEKGGRVAGTVVASSDNSPLKGVAVEVFASPYLLPAVTGTTDRLGYYLTGGGLPDGTAYTVRTTNSLGFINERYSDISCIDGCSPEPGGTVAITAPETTASIDFSLDVDSDQDADGIIGSIDTDKALPSDAFSDLPQGGTTAGIVVVRSGWTVSLGDLSAGGVVAELTGAGSGAVTVQTCAAGSAEEVGLDGAGAKANISCSPDTGSTTVRAVAAFPYIELRKTVSGLTTILELAPGQAATLGSPAVADPGNTEPVRVRLEDAQGSPVGSFALDPGESAEATESSSGLLSVTVFSGSVAVTVGEEVVTVGIGQSHGFVVCSSLGIERLIASPAALWPPNHKMAAVTLSPTLSGTCGTATCRVMLVTSNEPADGLGDGDTSPDWEIGEGLTVMLRAERAGGGSGRIYTVTIHCTDEAGNVVTKTAAVSVPRQR